MRRDGDRIEDLALILRQLMQTVQPFNGPTHQDSFPAHAKASVADQRLR